MSIFSNFIGQESENSIRSFLDVFTTFNRFVLKFLWLPILLSIGLGYYFFHKENSKAESYSANLSFVESSKLNTMPSINEYSLPSFGTRADDETDIITGVVNSDAVIGKALFSPVMKGSTELLINRFTKVYMPEYYKVNRFTSNSLDSLEFTERKVYKRIFERLTDINSELLTFESTEVKKISSKTSDEELSFALVNNVYNALVEFYESNQTSSYDNTINLLENKKDSIYRVLKRLEADLATKQQRSGLRITETEQLPNTDLLRKISLTQTNYQTLYAQIETLKTQQSQNFVTYFRQLNYPMLPLSNPPKDVLLKTVIGAAIGFFGGAFLVILLFLIIEGVRFYKTLYS